TDEECKRLWEVEILQDQQVCPCLPWTSSLNPYLEALDLVNYPFLCSYKSLNQMEIDAWLYKLGELSSHHKFEASARHFPCQSRLLK
ncbi:hypothetical protein PIB30_106324, partial [Stylosanthes scabra]|nr:hypothetical protein [Stylosanthes scabra]